MSKKKASLLKALTWGVCIIIALLYFFFVLTPSGALSHWIVLIIILAVLPFIITRVIDAKRKKQEAIEYEEKRKQYH